MKEEKPLWKGFLDIETVFKVINICRENSIYYNIYTEEEILAEKLQYNLLFYLRFARIYNFIFHI